MGRKYPSTPRLGDQDLFGKGSIPCVDASGLLFPWSNLQGEKQMSIKVGDKLPDATFMEMTADGPAPRSTADVFGGKTIALFAVPGAYTPTCSAKHLPGFVDHLDDFKAKGVDEVVCTSVNDVFVMGAWGKSAGADGKVRMLADGNGTFAKALGLEMDGSGFGMGQRSQRYSMIVKDGTVAELNVEQGGEFKVSSADYMLGQL
jgi:glutaredoxin/glutathione-dependent peroxiredoxin